MGDETIRLGCRFWPRRGGPFFLSGDSGGREGWDRGEVAAELAHVRDIGFDVVRVAVAWDRLQPEPDRLRASVVSRLESLLDLAADTGLQVDLTVAGRLGRTLVVPRWLLATDPDRAWRAPRLPLLSEGWAAPLPLTDPYTDPHALSGQRHLWHEIDRLFGSHTALGRLDPGAGGLLTTVPPHRAADAAHWWRDITESVTQPTGYGDGADLLRSTALPPLAEWVDQVGDLALALSPDLSSFAASAYDPDWPRFVHLLAQTLSGRPVGCVSLSAPGGGEAADEAQARFLGEVLPALAAAGAPLLTHGLWADAGGDQPQRPPFLGSGSLATSGLVDVAGREKAAAAAMRAVARAWAGTAVPPPRILSLDADEWRARKSESAWVQSLYREWSGRRE